MSDYSKGKIYKLVNDDFPNDVYYGSTIQALSSRLAQHKRDIKKKQNPPTSSKLFEKGKVIIVLVEKINCKDKKELHKRERFYIENNICLNKYIPLRTPAEYYQDNKDTKVKYYYENFKNNPEKVKRKNERMRERYKEKKEHIKAYSREPKLCECGIMTNKGHYNRHIKTKKHKLLMEEKE